MMEVLRMLIKTSRPISWVNTAYPFAAGYLLLGGDVDALFWVATLFFLIPYNLVMYGINDIFDYESDMRNPRKGGIEGAVTPKKYHSTILRSSLFLSLPCLMFIFLQSPGWLPVLVLSMVLFFVVAYSAKGLRFKEVPVLDSVTSSLHFIGPLLFAYSLYFPVPNQAWVIALAFFFWGAASHAFGAVQDIIPDREANIRSVATVLGARNVVWATIVLYICASVLVVFLREPAAIVIGVSGLVYACNVLPFLQITDSTSSAARKGWRRFLWLNYGMGAIVTMCIIYSLL